MYRRGAYASSYNGRGSRGGRWRGSRGGGLLQHSTAAPGIPFGSEIHTLTYEQLKASLPAAGSPKITGSQYIASFNWLESDVPTMIVPGVPPKWTPPRHQPQLHEDAGEYYRDINAAQYPQHSVEPAVRAVLAQNPSLLATEVDLFACGSTMGNLLRFSRGTYKTFRFIVEAMGETVFFIRREDSPTEKILDVRGYGHSMPEAYTSLDECVEKSVSYQRLIKYNLDGFECIVRYEGDGYLHDGTDRPSPEGHLFPDVESLRIIAGGKVVPQEAMFDIKTRSFRKKDDDVLAGEIDRLWLRQVPNFVLAYHKRGVFDDIEINNVTKLIAKWEADHVDEIRILSSLIAKIIAHARQQAGTAFEVCSQQPGTLEFRYVGGDFDAALPQELRQTWSRSGCDAADEADDESDPGVGSDAEGGVGIDSDDEAEPDYTACSAEDCGYCDRCTY